MLGVIILTVVSTVLVTGLQLYSNFRKNVEAAKRTGFPFIPLPIPGVGFFWSFLNELIIPPLRQLPFTRSWRFLTLNDRQDTYRNPRSAHIIYGDTYLTVAPTAVILRTSNAELESQITARKNDFLKPIDRYKIIDIFGRSIVTVEGQDWRRHRKVVGPSFSEKSNKLVFEESLRQARGIMEFWTSQSPNISHGIKVRNTAPDAATLSLHVICAAGFGLPQLWLGRSKGGLRNFQSPGLSTLDLSGGHTLTFKESMQQLLKGIRWLVIFPPWLLKISPFRVHKSVYQAYSECMAYFEELIAAKKEEIYVGEHGDDGTMDLMGPMIRASDEAPSGSNSNSPVPHVPILSRSELIGNSFVLFFAGHETSANGIHFSILLLAINLGVQRQMQADIDKIVGQDKPTSEFSYHSDMPRLYNSMVGAVFNEQLRLMPAILNVPKVANGDQVVTVDGNEFVIANGTFIQLNVVGTNRNPRYWPSSPSKVTPGTDDLNDFVPQRWLPSRHHSPDENRVKENSGDEAPDGLEHASFETSTPGSLFKPIKGSFTSFSNGMRACPGRRFAQVEVIAVLTAIFQKWSVELDITEWSDEEMESMSNEQKKLAYENYMEKARNVLRNCEQKIITLQMKKGDYVPVRFVERGKERFAGLF